MLDDVGRQLKQQSFLMTMRFLYFSVHFRRFGIGDRFDIWETFQVTVIICNEHGSGKV